MTVIKRKLYFLEILPVIVGILITWLSVIFLWVTREQDLPSQSAFAGEPNQIWYILMHISMTMTFFYLNSLFGIKKWMYGIVAFASIFTLGLDMYGFSMPHNISTVFIFASASYCLGWYVLRKYRLWFRFVAVILAVGFMLPVVGWTNLYTVYDIESIIQFSFGIMLLIDLLDNKKYL